MTIGAHSSVFVGLLAMAAVTSCARRAGPFRFGNPMLAGVTADPPQLGRWPADTEESSDAGPRRPSPDAGIRSPTRQVRAPVIRQAIAPKVADLIPPATGSRPAPHRQLNGLLSPPLSDATKNEGWLWLRQRVGQRTKQATLSAVLDWQRRGNAGSASKSSERLADNAAIVDHINAAQQSGHWMSRASLIDSQRRIEPGDLLVFDRTDNDQPASLIALCIATNDRGVSEMFYIAAGVVRRGFVTPARFALARDEQRRVLNTYLRHNRDWPPKGTRFLSGELLRGVIRWRDG